MRRRTWIAFCAALPACRRRALPMDVFPEAIGPWKRVSLRDVSALESPDPVPHNIIERAQEASYEGAGKLAARAYELASTQLALDLAQRWRPAPDTIFFWAQRYFVVVKWEQADRKSLQQFTSLLSKRLDKR